MNIKGTCFYPELITRGPLALYYSPECWGYVESEQTWKYKSTRSSISCFTHTEASEQIWPCHKNGQGQPRVIIWKKPQGMGIQPLGTCTSSGSILKLLLFPSFCTNFRKIPFASLFYMIFCFISYMYITPQGKKRQTLASRQVLSLWSLVVCFKKSSVLWFYAHFFMFL